MAHNYILQVTAGSEYDITTHKVVPVNSATPISIESDLMSVDLNVRIQNYRGLPRSSPSTSPYFSLHPHSKNGDQYSIAFKFSPKCNINGNDLVFGNDFDHPIRDRLPPGFSTAFKIVKWVVDPGLDGDVYADQPYLYGPANSSVNTLHVGSKSGSKTGEANAGEGKGEGEANGESKGEEDAGLVFEEGGDEDGILHRKEKGIPDGEAARKKHFLNEENRKAWEWEAGRSYGCDFFNPYLDFNDFALRLPGFTLPIMKYWDGQGLRKEQKRSHTLRYVLKNRQTDKVLFVVLFTLYLKEDVDEEGNIMEGVEEDANKPFELRDEGEAKKHGWGKGGSWWWGGGDGAGDEDVEEKPVERKGMEQNGKAVEATNNDDVD